MSSFDVCMRNAGRPYRLWGRGYEPYLSKGEKREATNGVAPVKTLQFFFSVSLESFAFSLVRLVQITGVLVLSC